MTSRIEPARRGGDRGAAAVEFALVAPLLLMLVFGIMTYGYMLSFRQALSQAAAEGARAAAVAPAAYTDAEVATKARNAVNDALGSYGVSCTSTGGLVRQTDPAGSCAISAPQACTSAGSTSRCVKVTLSYTYEADPLTPAFPGLGLVLPDTLSYVTEAQVS